MTILSKNAKYLETKVESQYGTEYHVDRISESLISQWQVVFIVVLNLIVIIIFNDDLLAPQVLLEKVQSESHPIIHPSLHL